MSSAILATKLYIPPPRRKVVPRSRLIDQLNNGLHHKLTLISAPAGFGKTTLVREWIAPLKQPTAWVSLDEGDNDPARFLGYLVAALRTVAGPLGDGVLNALKSPQPPPIDAILTALLNEITAISEPIVLVLDDYHVIDSKPIDTALTFLLKHLPPQLHIVIATREDPDLPLARLRAQGQLTELRVTDLRFTPSEAADFLTQVMGLQLTSEDILALEHRTEGWIAGLQLAAISLQGHKDTSGFIKSFTGSHHFVLDYLLEEVLHQQPESLQRFLLCTSILDRLCGPLCDALLGDSSESGQSLLESIERANLFIVPLDNERRWYRYHHLFADLLRQRLRQSLTSPDEDIAELHRRASLWYENTGLELDAFRHAIAAHDIDLAARLLEGKGMPLHFRGAIIPVFHWLKTLSASEMDKRPTLWVMYGSVLSMLGHNTQVEQVLQAAEAALEDVVLDARMRNLIGHIAAIRAMIAAGSQQIEITITQSHRALEYLHPNNIPVRTATTWKLGFAYQVQGDRVAAKQAYTEAMTISEASGNIVITLLAITGLANLQEADNQLSLAAQTYQRVLSMAGDPPMLIAFEAHVGLARLHYEWNDLASARQHAQQSLQLARQIENTDRFVSGEILLAQVKRAEGDTAGAAAMLAQTRHSVQQNFAHRVSEIAAVQVQILLDQGDINAAVQLTQTYDLPLSRARVCLAQNNPAEALAILKAFREQVEAKGWQDERLKVMILEAIALYASDEKAAAVRLLSEALALAESEGFIRLFIDEGLPMARLLYEAAAQGVLPQYTHRLLAAFKAETPNKDTAPKPPVLAQPLIEPLSERELEVLRLIDQGLSNHEISERLFLALSTIKGHNQRIFDKLQVQRRTEAVARARELGLL